MRKFELDNGEKVVFEAESPSAVLDIMREQCFYAVPSLCTGVRSLMRMRMISYVQGHCRILLGQVILLGMILEKFSLKT